MEIDRPIVNRWRGKHSSSHCRWLGSMNEPVTRKIANRNSFWMNARQIGLMQIHGTPCGRVCATAGNVKRDGRGQQEEKGWELNGKNGQHEEEEVEGNEKSKKKMLRKRDVDDQDRTDASSVPWAYEGSW